MTGSAYAALITLALMALCQSAAALQHQRALLQNAGPYNEDSLVGVPDEVGTGEQFGSGEKVNVCKFPLGSVNNWNLKPYIQYYSYSAELILATSGRGSFIAPAVGFLHFGPSCYLYDHVCNFNYQEPCNLRGVCQTNNTCACTNGYRTCRPQSGTVTTATAGCETNVYTDNNNCGACGNVCDTAAGYKCAIGGCFINGTAPSPPPAAAAPPPPPPSPVATTTSPSNVATESANVPSSPTSYSTDGSVIGGGGASAADGSVSGGSAASAEADPAVDPRDTVVAVPARTRDGSSGATGLARNLAKQAADQAAAAGRRLLQIFI